ncbi:MAG: asparagine synthetase B, partial [Actinomycetota bacterium]|nr:asparagine synthetase B [Actinomycetota bacterium]
MCGIAGFLGNTERSVATIERQLSLLEHRGPDSSGYFTGSIGTIGQTRLAVIDLDTGDPPISNEDGSVGVALNGEIYNFAALREELHSKDHRFSTKGDTEVLAHLAEDFDPVELAVRLDGMFAFAVLDDRTGRLILGRDRFGKKPLYYWASQGRFAFASEIKALLAHPQVPEELDEEALPAYLTFGYVPTPRTFFRDIRSLPPGHVLVVEPGREPRLIQYWSVQLPMAGEPGREDLSFDEAALQVRGHLTDVVRKRMVADVPLGAFLSG